MVLKQGGKFFLKYTGYNVIGFGCCCIVSDFYSFGLKSNYCCFYNIVFNIKINIYNKYSFELGLVATHYFVVQNIYKYSKIVVDYSKI